MDSLSKFFFFLFPAKRCKDMVMKREVRYGVLQALNNHYHVVMPGLVQWRLQFLRTFMYCTCMCKSGN